MANGFDFDKTFLDAFSRERDRQIQMQAQRELQGLRLAQLAQDQQQFLAREKREQSEFARTEARAARTETRLQQAQDFDVRLGKAGLVQTPEGERTPAAVSGALGLQAAPEEAALRELQRRKLENDLSGFVSPETEAANTASFLRGIGLPVGGSLVGVPSGVLTTATQASFAERRAAQEAAVERIRSTADERFYERIRSLPPAQAEQLLRSRLEQVQSYIDNRMLFGESVPAATVLLATRLEGELAFLRNQPGAEGLQRGQSLARLAEQVRTATDDERARLLSEMLRVAGSDTGTQPPSADGDRQPGVTLQDLRDAEEALNNDPDFTIDDYNEIVRLYLQTRGRRAQ